MDYINNKDFYAALVERREKLSKLKEGEELPLSDYIGNCIYQLCNRIGFMPSYINYSFKQEMIGDALENCIRVIDKFDPDKETKSPDGKFSNKKNPFGYFTQIAIWAFWRRIDKEKEQAAVRAMLIRELPREDMYDFDEESKTHYNFADKIADQYYFDLDSYEKKLDKKKPKIKSKTSLELFMEEN